MGDPRRVAVLAGTLSRSVLPGHLQELVLKVCLSSPDGPELWRRWIADVERPKYLLGAAANGVLRLLPLLAAGVRELDVPVSKELQTYLRTARMREQMRSVGVREICGRVFDVLRIPVVLLKGVAAAETVYPEFSLRHCHDLDLLVKPEDLSAAVRSLTEAAFQVCGEHRRSIVLRHSSGFPVCLHTALFRIDAYDRAFGNIWGRTGEASFDGRTVLVLRSNESLVHICGHAATVGSRFSPCWVADACLLLSSRSVDWPAVLQCADEGRLTIPLAVTFGYLGRSIGAQIPAEVLAELDSRARCSGVEAQEAALAAVLMSARRRDLGVVRAAGGWRERLRVIRWMLSPPVETPRRLT